MSVYNMQIKQLNDLQKKKTIYQIPLTFFYQFFIFFGVLFILFSSLIFNEMSPKIIIIKIITAFIASIIFGVTMCFLYRRSWNDQNTNDFIDKLIVKYLDIDISN